MHTKCIPSSHGTDIQLWHDGRFPFWNSLFRIFRNIQNIVKQLLGILCVVCYFKFALLMFRSAVAYLCGHLHTLGGLMPVLHSRHPQGTLELELGDWMDNRRYGGAGNGPQNNSFTFLLLLLLLVFYAGTLSHVCLQVQGSGLWPWPAEFLWPEVWAVACSAHHQPQGCTVPASWSGAVGSNTEIDTHQVCVDDPVCQTTNPSLALI